MSICKDCICKKYCGDDDIRRCDRYFKDSSIKREQTNEDFLCTATTEQLAEEILAWWVDGANTYSRFGLFKHEIDEAKEKIVEWLKQPHKPFS